MYVFLTVIFIICSFVFIACEEEEAFKSRIEKVQNWNVLYLKGSAYEMGYQQGKLYKEELAYIQDFFFGTPKDPIQVMFQKVINNGLAEGFDVIMSENSYEEIHQECQGMVDGSGGAIEHRTCISVNMGSFALEILDTEGLPVCSGFVATDEATSSGELIHARNQDWPPISFAILYPTIYVRKPNDGIPFVAIGYPAMAGIVTGINQEGIVVSYNDETTPTNQEDGVDVMQINRRALQYGYNLADVERIINESHSGTNQLLLFSSAKENTAKLFEMICDDYAIRDLQDNKVLYVTNSFRTDYLLDKYSLVRDLDGNSGNRHQRLAQLLEPDGYEPITTDSLYGSIDVPASINILRDTKHPDTGAVSTLGGLDMNLIGNNGVLHSMVFKPETGDFWLAGGIMEGESIESIIANLNAGGNRNEYIGFNAYDLMAGKSASASGLLSYP